MPAVEIGRSVRNWGKQEQASHGRSRGKPGEACRFIVMIGEHAVPEASVPPLYQRRRDWKRRSKAA